MVVSFRGSLVYLFFFFFKQKTAYEMRISDWSSDVCSSDLLAALNGWLRPKLIVPVHGEIRHMHEQARFAVEQGVPAALVQQNGDLCRLAPGPAKIVERVRSGRLVLDGDVILPADGETVVERRKLALNGQMSVAVALKGGRFAGSEARYRGVPVDDDRETFLKELNAAAERAATGPRSEEHTSELQSLMRISYAVFCWKKKTTQ